MMDTEDLHPKEEGELEDGEITSDEEDNEVVPPANSEEAVDYVLNERPTSWTETLKKQAASSSIADSSRQYQPPLRPTRPEPPTYYDDDDNSAESSSSDDSDEDGPIGKRTRRMADPSMTFKAPVIHGTSSRKSEPFSWIEANPFDPSGPTAEEENDAFRNQATMFQQKRKPNNIWSTVLQEEEVSDIFGKVNVQEMNGRDVLIDRGPESFSIKYKQRPPIRRRSDSSSLSSGGLTDNELDFLRGEPAESSVAAGNCDVQEGDDTGDMLPQNFGSRPLKRRRTKQAHNRKKNKNKMVNRLKKMNGVGLGKYMAGKLEEPKHQLLIKAVQIIGKEPCISLFLKTMKIERRGGLLIKNQERRRTAGGVFFYLLRGDRKFPSHLVDQVFQEERQNQTHGKKKESAKRRLKRKAKLEAKKGYVEEKEEKCDDVAFQVNQECMEEDSDGSLPDEPNESEVDSDEYYRIQEAKQGASLPVDTSRGLVSYEAEGDCLDLHCDPTELE